MLQNNVKVRGRRLGDKFESTDRKKQKVVYDKSDAIKS
jgi:hypothetical protein